ncbi:MAG TPA: SpoIIE family protein phosphatase, partial [Thermoanaerobaculia bacterium]|nr:SpoIIE family protein phosphatase [Thermoanaerobaculia bacterium]
MSKARPDRALLGAVALGLGLFAAALGLAWLRLPEWQVRPLPDRALFEQRYRQIADRLGVRLAPGRPYVRLMVEGNHYSLGFQVPGYSPGDRLAPDIRTVAVQVFHAAALPGQGSRELEVDFALDGRPYSIQWSNVSPGGFFGVPQAASDGPLADRMQAELLEVGETARGDLSRLGNLLSGRRPIQGALGAIPLEIRITLAGFQFEVERQAFGSGIDIGWSGYALGFGFFVFFAAVFGSFFYLAVRRQISVTNGALLSALVLLTWDWPRAIHTSGWGVLWIDALIFLWYFVLWSTAESLVRTVDPDSTAGLDAIRSGRFSRRAGRAVLLGFAFGAGLAAFHLAAHAAATLVPGLAPGAPTVTIPFLSDSGGLVADALWLAGLALLCLAVTSRWLPSRWVLPISILALTWFGPIDLSPGWVEMAANLAFVAVLLHVGRRHGLTALLTASLLSFLLPTTAFTLLHLGWIPAGAALLAACVLLGIQGVVGLSRPTKIEEELEVRPPAFVRRMEEERRFQYELDLLARMQLGLLPQELPAVKGYELAARSILATEAGGDLYDFHRDADGGLWITAGDVAGHGYSCAVSQAMIKAALASLIPSRRSPAEVLGRLHRVLKEGGPERRFTTLALLRLQPEAGEVLFSNAGHPAPVLASAAASEELDLPGLPLGQGPPRQYGETRF